jgi:CDP-glucose 4,6-dehydratase
MAVLVTGAQGFVGSWLAERLLGRGERVIVPDRPAAPGSRFREEHIGARCEPAPLDVTDPASVLRVLREHDVRAVFHLASRSIVEAAERDPHATWETNVRGTYGVLDACRRAGAERVVVASSSLAYGPGLGRPFREDDALRATHPYAASKAAADIAARTYAAHGLRVAVVRMANVYGGGDLSLSRLVPDACRALAAGERPVLRSDGTPQREVLYVEDAVDAYLAVAASLDDPAQAGRAWNAGSGEVPAAVEVVRRLIRVAGLELEPDVRGAVGRPRPPGARLLRAARGARLVACVAARPRPRGHLSLVQRAPDGPARGLSYSSGSKSTRKRSSSS